LLTRMWTSVTPASEVMLRPGALYLYVLVSHR